MHIKKYKVIVATVEITSCGRDQILCLHQACLHLYQSQDGSEVFNAIIASGSFHPSLSPVFELLAVL